MLIGHCAQKHQAQNIFIIGNAFGWSTFALTLSCPHANIVVIDNFQEGSQSHLGHELSLRIKRSTNSIDFISIRASSPQDVPKVAAQYFPDGKSDFVLIDGNHTNEQLMLDFAAVRQIAHEKQIIFLHDVLNLI